MATGETIRGHRVGAGPVRRTERGGDHAPRQSVTYWCANGHATEPSFAADVAPPARWDCPHCGLPAGPDRDNPPTVERTERYKSHLAYVKERRSDADGAAILAEALARAQQRRGHT